MKTQFGKRSKADFNAPAWARNAHIQTIWPKFFATQPTLKTAQERISTPDNDFLDLAWLIPKNPKRLLIAFHGLEGSVDSHYIRFLFDLLHQANIACVLMHFRGCSGEHNLLPRAYHSGEITDAAFVIDHVQKRYPTLPLMAVGFSLGGNMLLKLLASQQTSSIERAIAVSAPINLKASSEAINQGFSRFYQNHLLKSMKSNLLQKMDKIDMSAHLNVNKEQIESFNSFYAFDEHITSQLHGYEDADDYYTKASALPDLHKIMTPTLILHAKDDPFMDDRVIPQVKELSANTAYELSDYGGHVGFMHGSVLKPKMWLPERILRFISEDL